MAKKMVDRSAKQTGKRASKSSGAAPAMTGVGAVDEMDVDGAAAMSREETP
jgi:hypothetical protein